MHFSFRREKENVNIHNEYGLIKQSLKEFVKNVTCEDRIESLGKSISDNCIFNWYLPIVYFTDIDYYKEHAKKLYSQLNRLKIFVKNKIEALKDNQKNIQNEVWKCQDSLILFSQRNIL